MLDLPRRKLVAKHPKDDVEAVYIGRGGGSRPRSKWAHPFPVQDWGRAVCLEKFEEYARKELWDSLEELRGRVIACHCRLNQSCHGDVLSRLLAEKLTARPRSLPSRTSPTGTPARRRPRGAAAL